MENYCVVKIENSFGKFPYRKLHTCTNTSARRQANQSTYRNMCISDILTYMHTFICI